MTMTLHDFPTSGHAHRIRLFLSMLGVDYDRLTVDMPGGGHKTADYLRLSPLGQVPTLVDGEIIITDSSAALVYLAKKYGRRDWLPEDPAGAAAVQRWLSTASGELYRGPIALRAARRFGRAVDEAAARSWSKRLFEWMQAHLEIETWLAAKHATIADVAMYSYVRVADEGGLDLAPYPAVLRWLADVEALPGFEPMPR
ncbi:MAG: glutathione S-transferase family protein [Gammaproteobacteria bacterium]|nr:glutathione S-transferase family protein [Gammaproteobacteria bacterium]MDH4255244.1 glutathione S-transferase family protein [Gammaproteobacteria bacterium]MDH5310055.1 glutathione S-transferase family protein [Gammaproteobacteria bacterium]